MCQLRPRAGDQPVAYGKGVKTTLTTQVGVGRSGSWCPYAVERLSTMIYLCESFFFAKF